MKSLRTFILSVGLLCVFSASAVSLDEVSADFTRELTSTVFKADEFCEKFWAQDQLDTCTRSIPWEYVRSLHPTFKRSIPTGKNSTAFTLFSLGQVGTLLLTTGFQQMSWRFSIDEKSTWQDFSEKWQIDKKSFEVRFAAKINDSQMKELKNRIQAFHTKIANSLGLQQQSNIPFYFLNSRNIATDLETTWPRYISGGARDGFVLIIGDPFTGNWSTVFHELVHMYTTYPGAFWNGKGVYPNAVMSEGLASWFQIKNVWQDSIDPKMIATNLCKSTQLAEELDSVDFWKIFDDNFFRKFNSKDVEHFPAYVVGAAIIDYFQKSMSREQFKELWNQIGEATNAEDRKAVILKVVEEKQLIGSIQEYYSTLRQQMVDHAEFSCMMVN